jgi:hypothetical protein
MSSIQGLIVIIVFVFLLLGVAIYKIIKAQLPAPPPPTPPQSPEPPIFWPPFVSDCSSYWAEFKANSPDVAMDIEALLGRDMYSLSDTDARQIVTTLQRASINLGLPIKKLRDYVNDVLFSHCSCSEDLDPIIAKIESNEIDIEAATFQIKRENTFCYLILQWAVERKVEFMSEKISKQPGNGDLTFNRWRQIVATLCNTRHFNDNNT